MSLSQQVIEYIATAALDFYFNKGTAFQQSLQDRPLVDKMESGAKTFPGGKGNIVMKVQGHYGAGGVDDSLVGYTGDDTVEFYNPTNLDDLAFAWREHHIGISLTHTELKHDGLSVTDEHGATSNHTERDRTVLINMWENKLFDFGERYARSLNDLLWGDGTADPKALHGLRHFIVADPSAGTVGGKDRSVESNAYLRNRARTAAFGAKVADTPSLSRYGGDAVTSSPENGGALIEVLGQEMRQLRKFGGKPTMFFCGSDFYDAYSREIRANGFYSMTGFRSSQDGAMGALNFDGIPLIYDPTLDDLGLAKRAYIYDPNHIFLMKMDNEWRRVWNPARPHNQFVLRRSMTSTGQVVARQINSSLVIDIT